MPFASWGARHIPIVKLGRFLLIEYNCGGSFMGRCGGGWAFKFAIMGGGSTICIELTIITIRINWSRKK